MIKTNPEKLIAQGTDWRFLKEIEKELRRRNLTIRCS